MALNIILGIAAWLLIGILSFRIAARKSIIDYPPNGSIVIIGIFCGPLTTALILAFVFSESKRTERIRKKIKKAFEKFIYWCYAKKPEEPERPNVKIVI